MISLVILTYNEEVNIARCLRSVAWSDDIVVVDSFSKDRTLAIAAEFGVRVLQRPFDDFAGQRNFALDHGSLKHDWVFHLDADEVITSALHEELLAKMKSGAHPAYRVASKLMLHGRWLRHAGLFPWYQVRFGRKDALRFRQVGHGQRETLPPDQVGTLNEALLHYPFEKGLHDWIEKHNRYSTAEARNNLQRNGHSVSLRDVLSASQDARLRALKHLFANLPCRPTLRFLYMYLWRRGILDGRLDLLPPPDLVRTDDCSQGKGTPIRKASVAPCSYAATPIRKGAISILTIRESVSPLCALRALCG
jgi:glycosyltransferase involved in cell wall biosynthesis